MSTGFSRPSQIWSASQWNEMLRRGDKGLLDGLRYLFSGDAAVAEGGLTLGGGTCAAGSGAATDCAAGAVAFFNATAFTSVLGGNETVPDLLIPSWAAATVTHSDGHATNARKDLICAQIVVGTSNSQSIAYKSASPITEDLQWGAEVTITVVKGIEDGTNVLPATPTGAVALFQVQVPAGTVAGTWAASVTYTDLRVAPVFYARGAGTRAFDAYGARILINPLEVNGVDLDIVGAGKVDVTKLVGGEVGLQMEDRVLRLFDGSVIKGVADGTEVFDLFQVWDNAESAAGLILWTDLNGADPQWPRWQRVSPGAGEASGDMYPMMVPAGRTWRREYPWTEDQNTIYAVGSAADLSIGKSGYYTSIARQSAGAVDVAFYHQLVVDSRGLEITAAEAMINVAASFTSTVTAATIALYHIPKDSYAPVQIGSYDMAADLAAAPATSHPALTMSSTPVLAEGDALMAIIGVTLVADGTAAGELRVVSLGVQFKEGRA
jgi:hypothetical protein